MTEPLSTVELLAFFDDEVVIGSNEIVNAVDIFPGGDGETNLIIYHFIGKSLKKKTKEIIKYNFYVR